MRSAVGDVTVVGLDTTTTVLYDIGMDVPHRVVVTIPADKATLSKDLWRAISQRRLFQLHPGIAGSVQRPLPATQTAPDWKWMERCRQLEAENAQLRATIAQLEQVPRTRSEPKDEAGFAALQAKLDEVLSTIKTAGVSTTPGVKSKPAPLGVVEVDVPAFIPTEIKPKDIEGRITEVTSETSEASNLGSAASALRKFRKGQ